MGQGRTIVVGDIHGCAEEMKRMLDVTHFEQGVDRLVLVGDLVARGPDSRGVVETAMSVGALAVRGNHDERLCGWWRARASKAPVPKLNDKHLKTAETLEDKHFVWLDNLPLMLQLQQHALLVVHAGVDPRRSLESQDPSMLLHIRSIGANGEANKTLDGTPWSALWSGRTHIVFGHDARRGLQLAPNATGLDTGCCYGRALTALVLDAEETVPVALDARRSRLVSLPAERAYCSVGDGNGPE